MVRPFLYEALAEVAYGSLMGVIGGGYFFVGPANLRFDSVFRDFIQGQQYVGVPYPVSGGPPGFY